MIVATTSPMRNPPTSLSREQLIYLDGLRYTANGCDLAFRRLKQTLDRIAATEPTDDDLVEAMQDAWSLIDAVHRFGDLLEGFPGLRGATWRVEFKARFAEAGELRNSVQHQRGEISQLATAGDQLWGRLSWHQFAGDRPTGRWVGVVAGRTFRGNSWLFVTPTYPDGVSADDVALWAFGRRVFLGHLLSSVVEAVRLLEFHLTRGELRSLGPAAGRSGADEVYEMSVEVFRTTASPPDDSAAS